jgi:hypothetical protein
MDTEQPLNFHAIIGPNGMCMCGVKEDGTVVTCGGLLKAQQQQQLEATTARVQALLQEWRETAKERKRHHSSQWIWGEGAIYDKCADALTSAITGDQK